MTALGSPSAARLGLGTVQLGLTYGVTNRQLRADDAEARALLSHAAVVGLSVLDTASLYGDSEEVIGRCLTPGSPLRIVTKTPPVAESRVTQEHVDSFRAAFRRSLERLRRESVYGLLIHHGWDVTKPGAERLIEVLEEEKAAGTVERNGVSVYSGEEIDAVLARFTPDIIQLPISLADQRLVDSGHLTMLKERGVEIHARSLFLQGVLLAEPDDLPSYFASYRPSLNAFASALRTRGLTRLEACLSFALARPELDILLVGVAQVSELDDILAALGRVACCSFDATSFSLKEEKLLDPSQWRI